MTEYEALEEVGIFDGRGWNSVANGLKLVTPPRGKLVPDPTKRKKAKVSDPEGTSKGPPRKGQLMAKPSAVGARPPPTGGCHPRVPGTARPPSGRPVHPPTFGHASRGEKIQDLKAPQTSPLQKRKREPSSGDRSSVHAIEPERGVAEERPPSRGTSQATSSSSGSSSSSSTGSSSVGSLVRKVEEQMEEGELGSTPRGGSEAPVIQYRDAFDSLFRDEG